MAGYTLWDPSSKESLFPFTYTRPVAECRTGILTIREKWELMLGAPVSHEISHEDPHENFTQGRNPSSPDTSGNPHISVNGALIPDEDILKAILRLKPGESLLQGNTLLAIHRAAAGPHCAETKVTYEDPVTLLERPWDLCRLNDQEIRRDFIRLTRGRRSEPADALTRVINPDQVFIEPGARISCAVLNAEEGPIYIGRSAVVTEGALIRGPFALGEAATVKMGARIYGATTIGPGSVAGGEIKNSILSGFSNKSHDGYLGDAVIGHWCNLGAGTSCSNLKNNLKPVRILDEFTGTYHEAGLKCGLIMGDFSRTAVNTTFHTGSLVGISTHVFTTAPPPVYLTSFLWAGDSGIREYQLEKAISDAAAWKKLKGAAFTEADRNALTRVFQQTSSYRKPFLQS